MTSDGVSLETDHSIFDDILWPVLARRVPAFEELKVCPNDNVKVDI